MYSYIQLAAPETNHTVLKDYGARGKPQLNGMSGWSGCNTATARFAATEKLLAQLDGAGQL